MIGADDIAKAVKALEQVGTGAEHVGVAAKKLSALVDKTDGIIEALGGIEGIKQKAKILDLFSGKK